MFRMQTSKWQAQAGPVTARSRKLQLRRRCGYAPCNRVFKGHQVHSKRLVTSVHKATPTLAFMWWFMHIEISTKRSSPMKHLSLSMHVCLSVCFYACRETIICACRRSLGSAWGRRRTDLAPRRALDDPTGQWPLVQAYSAESASFSQQLKRDRGNGFSVVHTSGSFRRSSNPRKMFLQQLTLLWARASEQSPYVVRKPYSVWNDSAASGSARSSETVG